MRSIERLMRTVDCRREYFRQMRGRPHWTSADGELATPSAARLFLLEEMVGRFVLAMPIAFKG